MLSWQGQVGSTYVERGEKNVEDKEPYYRARNVSLSDASPCSKIREAGSIRVINMVE